MIVGHPDEVTPQDADENQPFPPDWSAMLADFCQTRPHWALDEAANLTLGLRPDRKSFTLNPAIEKPLPNLRGPWELNRLEKQFWRVRNLIDQAIEDGRLDPIPSSGPLFASQLLNGQSRSDCLPVYVDREEYLAFARANLPDLLVDDLATPKKSPKPSAQTRRHTERRDSSWLVLFTLLQSDPERYMHTLKGKRRPNMELLARVFETLHGNGVFGDDFEPLTRDMLADQFREMSNALAPHIDS